MKKSLSFGAITAVFFGVHCGVLSWFIFGAILLGEDSLLKTMGMSWVRDAMALVVGLAVFMLSSRVRVPSKPVSNKSQCN